MADTDVRQAPFNMALNTLESIRDWIDKIADLSVGFVAGQRVDPNEMIVIKHRMVKQLIMLTTPLLTPRDLEEIEEFYSEIKLAKGDVRDASGIHRGVSVYSQKVDYDLDECAQGIQKSLQDSGHFMPAPDESSLF